MKKFVLILFSASILLSCNTDELDFDNIELQPVTGTFGFPLGESSYVLRDLLNKQTGDSLGFTEDTTGLFTLQYYDTIRYSAPNDFVEVGDQVYSGSITAPNVGNVMFDSLVQLTETFTVQYDANGTEELDSVFYNTGQVTIDVNSTLISRTEYDFTFEGTIDQNTRNPLAITNQEIDGPGTATHLLDLAGYQTNLTNPDGTNSLRIFLDVRAFYAAGDPVDDTQSISFDITYANQTFSVIFGKFGQDTVQVGNQSINLDFFSQNQRDGITFGEPSILMEFDNTFGVPLELDLSGISATDDQGVRTELAGRIVRTPPTVAGSDPFTATAAAPGDLAETDIEINSFNSSIINLLSKNPDELVFDLEAISNPVPSTNNNYLHEDSEIEVFVTMDLPMSLQLENLQETGTYGLGDGIELENVDSAFIRVVTLNELPFAGTLKLDIMGVDTTTNDTTVLYTAADNLIIQAPFIDVQGNVTDPSGSTEDVPIGPEGVDALATASFVQITLTLNTPASQTSREIYVKIRGDYRLEVTLGVGGTFNLEIE